MAVLRPNALVCARRLGLLCILVIGVSLALFTDVLLTFKTSTNRGFEEEEFRNQDAEYAALEPAKDLAAADQIVVRQELLSDSSKPVALTIGLRGRVLQVDAEGDAEILFPTLGREWIYSTQFSKVSVLRRQQLPRPAAASSSSSSSSSSSPALAPAPAQAHAQAPAAFLEPPVPTPAPTPRPRPPPRLPPPPPAPPPPPEAPKDLKFAEDGTRLPPVLYKQSVECKAQALEVGSPQTPEECDRMVVEIEDCGFYFQFSEEHPDWKCRCCKPNGGEIGGPHAPAWAVWKVRSPSLTVKALGDPEGDGYKPQLYSKNHECDNQVNNFGHQATIEDCDKAAAADASCGAHFMFSRSHPDWACRCCSSDGADEGPSSPHWDVYAIQSPLPESRKARLPVVVLDPLVNLPIDKNSRPDWLVKDDGLVVDARGKRGGGILILQAVLVDASKGWGKKQGFRPRWLRAILGTNRAHARKWGHALILRGKPTEPQLVKWELDYCKSQMKALDQCRKDFERENFNWEKHMMLAEYLNSPEGFDYVMMLDADAAFIQPEHNTMKMITDLMEKNGKDLFLTDEDWLKYGEGRINGGLIVAKNTEFTRNLFQDTFDAHVAGHAALKTTRIGVSNLVCSSNEQICLNDLWKGGRGKHFSEYTMMMGGKKWNHGAEIGGFDDPEVEILHFMGGAKGTADKVLCDGSRDVTLEGPRGYGCKP